MRNRDWPKDRGTGLQRACRWACRKWNTTGCRTVVPNMPTDRRLGPVPSAVAIGRRVGEGVDRACMLNDTANVVQCGLHKSAYCVPAKMLLPPLKMTGGNACGTVVVDHWLRHECSRLTVIVGTLHYVFVNLHTVGNSGQVLNLRPNSCCDRATSWWCFSISSPISVIVVTISARRSVPGLLAGRGNIRP